MLNVLITLMLMYSPITMEPKEYARQYVKNTHNVKQWKCYQAIIYRESRWQPTAENGKYYGLGQLYGTKERHKGKPRLQVRKALEYMINRYGTPCNAYSFHLKNGWY